MASNMAFVNNSQTEHSASTSGLIPNFHNSEESAFSEFYDEVIEFTFRYMYDLKLIL